MNNPMLPFSDGPSHWIERSKYDALEAEYMALSQDDGKVERALESAQARIRELEAALRLAEPELPSNTPWGIVSAVRKAIAGSASSDGDERRERDDWLDPSRDTQ